MKKQPLLRLPALACLPLLPFVLPASGGIVVNPSFESNYNDVWPHYSPIDGWTNSGGGPGVNLNDGPFHNTGTAVPDQNRVAFLQGSAGLSQVLSGLEPAKRYWVQYFYDARLGSLFDLSVTWDGEPIDSVTGVLPATNQLYRFRNAVFTPASDFGELTFQTSVTGDSTLLLDAVCVVQRDEGEVILLNPGFEASGDVEDPGLVTQLAGWVISGNVGVNSPTGPFANNGTIPEQDHVVFIQQAGRISQTLKGLIPGQNYAVSFRCNARTGNTPHLLVTAAGNTIYDQDVTAVGAGAAYRTVNVSFIADTDTVELAFEQTVADGDNTVLLDDIHVKGEALPPLPDLIVGPGAIELAPETTGLVSVTVSGERLARGQSVVRLRSSNPGVAEFTAVEDDGLITLTFDAGSPTTTLTAEVQGLARGFADIVVEDNGGHEAVQGTVRVEIVNSFVRNPSFENNSGIGVGYGVIEGWTQSPATGSGLNNSTMPFVAGTSIPDRRQAVFVQGAGILSQQIYGLTPGKTYQLQFFYNARNCCGGIPSLAASIDGVDIATITDIEHAGQFYFHQVAFQPEAASVELAFRFTVPAGGDGSGLLDAVSIVERPSTDITVINPSFEASGLTSWPGYLSGNPIAGWTTTGGFGVNVDERGPFADNGVAGAQDRVLLMQNNASASQMISGLTAGESYTLTFLMNARNGDAAGGTPYQILVDDMVLEEGVQDPVGPGNPYVAKSFTFEALSDVANIQFKSVPPGNEDQTLLIDDVRVFPGSPPAMVVLTAKTVAGNSVALSWPASSDPTLQLMSSTSLQGAWTVVNVPVTVENGSNTVVEPLTGTRKFYRLEKP